MSAFVNLSIYLCSCLNQVTDVDTSLYFLCGHNSDLVSASTFFPSECDGAIGSYFSIISEQVKKMELKLEDGLPDDLDTAG